MNWKTATADDKRALIRSVQAVEPVLRLNLKATVVETLALPFYPNTLLLRFDKGQPRAEPLWYIKQPDDIVVLDGSLANIHHVNATAPLQLTAETCAGYLKFWLYFTKRSQLESALIAPQETGFSATARLQESDGAYDARFVISSRGETEMLKKERRSFVGKALPQHFTLTVQNQESAIFPKET